jgi:hypothetical protein
VTTTRKIFKDALRISWLAPGERITNTSNYDMRSCKALARMTSFEWMTDGPKDVEIVDYHYH